ncbi:MAG: hypothetical protein LR008_02820 [Candidatus Pacebacteria bacterium]|nr:hypothetical protein [Candidatus Paceibacterota bacterium]
MNPKVQEQLDEQEIKISDILQSVRKTEKYMKWTFWTTIVVIILPALLLVFALPSLISSYTSALEGLI